MKEISGEIDEDTVECLTCMDTGEYIPAESDFLMPCPSCERGIWNDILETADNARREQMREDAS